ncbi:putative non-specific serine/threonine protein kinase [Helianthus annuus]|uniref:Non-specific serine/threonine protein kinase n=1 Tax=Helianthus annuus TaxID=4232 RepID=A0A251VRU2_HELAN|nr:receptor-like protein EIX2 [Helianthus annuus]KAF5823048.1 putative non-specific serine/threonine protein kinase [Helianthus annuus]KAJ0627806.1 putative non-specific serine/threonine protein kinase [Helianthus annuus]KAJ0949085.1 putative non-specific serine/threonine protein kinase [Helianthus annuus]
MGRSRRSFRFSISVFLLVHFILIRREAAETRCIESERRALLRLKRGFVDDHGLLSSWSNHRSSQDCCLWRGVDCNNKTGNVIVLDLHGYWSDDLDAVVQLSGDINSSLLDLKHLNHLDLSFNSFTRIPEFVGSLRKLRYLNLSSTSLEVSKVPPQLGNLSNIQILDFSYSSIVLRNTEWLSKLSSLEYLSLSGVDLSKSSNLLENVITRLPSLFELHLVFCLLPKFSTNTLLPITNFSKVLSILDISDNYLPPSMIYPWLFNFSNSLIDIDLSYNELNGSIPEAFCAFTSLQKLDLTTNGLKGRIPTSFGNFSNLRSLYLGGNSLKEDLSNFFHLLKPAEKSLQVLDLSSNELFGSLPDVTKFAALKELYLPNNDIKGSFPERFEHISNLVIIDLADNHITGLIPDLSALSSLQELYFERNNLRGTLADKIMPLFELQSLGASSNLLNGTITETHVSNLSRLVYLDLSYNSLALEIDHVWSPTFSLDVMSFSSCKLGPSFPTWLQTQKNFSILDISATQINDSVPDWFWDQLTPNLRYLNLSSNQIHGIVPNLLYGNQPYIDLRSNNFYGPVPLFPSNTQTLVLRNNMFSGSVSFLCNFTTIFRLDLSNNQLSGELPDCWINLTNFFYVNLENNKLSGRIPASMGSLTYLQMLSLRSNNLTGELPSSLKNCTMLTLLDVGENSLSGRIPTWIGKSLTELRVLSLTSSGFHGTMPTSLCRLSKMQILDLSINNISGSIPRCLSNLKGMTDETKKVQFFGWNTVGLSRTRLSIKRDTYTFEALLQWKGRQYQYSNTLGLVTSLDLSSNSLNGEIPREITNLSGLVALNLSRNNLTWRIPQDIGRLRWLDFLDLSRNYLSGGIPVSLSQLTNLGLLDLSYNNLSGRIPTSTQLQSFGASSYTGNPALCGLPLSNPCPGDLVPDQSPRTTVETEDIGDQDKLITRGFFICLSTGLALGFWGFFGTLFISDSWRYAYLKFLDHITNWIYVVIAVNYNRLLRRS